MFSRPLRLRQNAASVSFPLPRPLHHPFPHNIRSFHSTPKNLISSIPGVSGVPDPEEEDDDHDSGKKESSRESRWRPMLWKMLESTGTTLASVSVLGYVLAFDL